MPDFLPHCFWISSLCGHNFYSQGSLNLFILKFSSSFLKCISECYLSLSHLSEWNINNISFVRCKLIIVVLLQLPLSSNPLPLKRRISVNSWMVFMFLKKQLLYKKNKEPYVINIFIFVLPVIYFLRLNLFLYFLFT